MCALYQRTAHFLQYSCGIPFAKHGPVCLSVRPCLCLSVHLSGHLLPKYWAHFDDIRYTSARLGVLRRIRPFISQDVAKLLFNAMVLPLLDYGDTVWANTYDKHLDRLQKLQNRAARIILQCKTRDMHVTDMFTQLGWMTCAQRQRLHKAIMVYKSVNSLAPAYMSRMFHHIGEIHSHSTRQAAADHLFLPKIYSESGKRSFKYSGTITFNSIPIEVRSVSSLHVFKKTVIQHMLNP
jgi:hypothetical protein